MTYFDKINLENIGKFKKNKKEIIEIKNKIVIKDLKFSYNLKDNLFSNLNLEIKIGDTIGIFGDSGSGKSSFINLLIGLLKPKNGQILIDGIDINSNINSWRESIGYVPQNIFLIDDTLRRNISFDLELDSNDEKKLNECLKQSELINFVNNLQNGLDTIVGERGSRISGGQLQRVGIARALYNDPKILIFDESLVLWIMKQNWKLLKIFTNLKEKNVDNSYT